MERQNWKIAMLVKVFKLGGDTSMFTFRDIRDNINDIVQITQSIGKTPENSANYYLQCFRDDGIIKFLGKSNAKGKGNSNAKEKGKGKGKGKSNYKNRGKYVLLSKDIEYHLSRFKSKMSRGEFFIMEQLRKVELMFEQQKILPGLIYKSHLRLDFYLKIEGKPYVIEVDGPPHRLEIKHYGGQKALEEIQARDKKKDTYCIANGIPLTRMEYDRSLKPLLIAFNNWFEQIKLLHPCAFNK